MTEIIPRANELLGKGHEALIAVRPSTRPHLAAGRYGDVLLGWRAQAQLVLQRLAQEAIAARLPHATGTPLLELLASEFDAIIDPGPQAAVGQVRLRRTKNLPSQFPGGLIRQGTRFRRPANPTASPPAKEALYETIEPVFVGSEVTALPPPTIGYTQVVTLYIRAVTPGAHANISRSVSLLAVDDDDPPIELADTLFDTFDVVYGDAAGGSDGPSTAKLRSLGYAIATGQYGPNLAAISVALLLTAGISHVAVREDPTYGGVLAWFVDDSWCWSYQLKAAAQQVMQQYLGFGCKINYGFVSDVPVSVTATAYLRDRRHVADSEAIAAKARTALVGYFTARSDWWTWNANGIKGAISLADRRVASVGTPVVQLVSDGSAVAAPSAELPDAIGITTLPLIHHNLDDSNVRLTLLAPT